MAKLAREMAMNIRHYQAMFADFGITEEDYYEIEQELEFFKRAKEQFALEWNSALSAADRVKMTSATAAEEVLATITKRMLNPQEPLPQRARRVQAAVPERRHRRPQGSEQKPSERFADHHQYRRRGQGF